MPIKYKNEETGQEEEYYSAAEREEFAAPFKTEAETAKSDLDKANKVIAEKTTNFKKFNEMSQEEKDRHSANEINLIKNNDELRGQVEDLNKKLSDKEKREQESARNSALGAIYGDNADLKKTVEENYAKLAGMPETTSEEIQARATEAARLSGITADTRNPLYQTYSSAAPSNSNGKKEYTDTEKGSSQMDAVRERLNLAKPEAKK